MFLKTPSISKQSLQAIIEQKKGATYLKSGMLRVSIISLVIIALVVILQRTLPPQVPLYYGLPRGEEQLAPSINLIIPSLLSLAIVVVNSSILLVIEDDFLQKVLVFTAAACVFFSSITTIQIFFLVGAF